MATMSFSPRSPWHVCMANLLVLKYGSAYLKYKFVVMLSMHKYDDYS